LAEVKNCCNLLSKAALYDMKQQNLTAAHRELLAMSRLAARQTPEPLIISQLVRQACSVIAFTATWQALQQEGWKDEQLAALQKEWTGMNLIEDMEASLGMERALTLDFYKQVRSSTETLEKALDRQVRTEEVMGAYMGKLPAHGFALWHIFAPLWKIAWAPQDEAAALRQWNVIVREARVANSQGWKQPVDALDDEDIIFPGWQPEAEERNLYDRCRFLFFALTANGIQPRMIRRTIEYQTQQQMVLAVIALERYKLRENRYPENLAELVPTYLHEIPIDHLDKQPLRYSRGADGTFTLYSVGENGKDDLGNPQPEDTSRHYRGLWDGRDAVWPNRATKEQAEAAVL
jgi:hypothetical protein